MQGFWEQESAEKLIGKNVYELEKEGAFSPNITDLCLAQKKRLSLIQEAKNGKKSGRWRRQSFTETKSRKS